MKKEYSFDQLEREFRQLDQKGIVDSDWVYGFAIAQCGGKAARVALNRSIFLVLLLTLSAAFSLSSAAQTSTSLTGHVVDDHGANVKGADVRLRSREGAQLAATTDDKGSFHFSNLTPGNYLVEVKASGFATLTSNEVHLVRGQSENLDLTLKIASINESVVITATGTLQRADEVSKAVSVVDSQEIVARRQLTLSETLRGIPGLRVQQQGSPGELSTLRLRGLRNFDTAILLDGLRVRDASDINGSAASLISDLVTPSLDRVEVLRGSGSSIYGTNAIGGVINLVPATGGGQPRFEVGWDGGSLATYHEHIKGSGGLGERAGFAFGLNRIDVRHGVDGQDQYGNSGGTGKIIFNATPSITISGNFYFTISNARTNDSPFALPAAFGTGQRFPQAVAGVNFHSDVNNPDEGRRNRLLVGSARFTQQVNETVSYTFAYQRVSNKRRNYNGPAIDPKFAAFYPFGDFEFVSVNEGATDTFDGRVNVRLGQHNLATGGFEFENETLFQNSIPSFSAFNKTTDRQRTFAVFGQDQIFLLNQRLQLSIGVRSQAYRIRAADRPGQLSAATAENSITGDGSISYFIPASHTKLRAHAGNGFRAASLFERFGAGTFAGVGFVRFGDPTLRAEKSFGVDGGIDQRLAKDKVIFGATYFFTRLQRVIAFTGFAVDPLGAGRFSGYVNREGGKARGIETYLEATPWRGTHIRSAYTYTNSERRTAASVLVPEYVIPKHLFSFELDQRYRAFDVNFALNRTGSYIAPVFENDFPFRTAELTFSGYTKAALFGSYEHHVSERVTAVVFAGADNLFNQTYYENGYRAPGITGRGGVTFKF
jgi:iron complex outermembrane receptor protein